MNLPNKLTIMRVILIPFFVFFLLSPYFPAYGNYIAVAIFIVARRQDCKKVQSCDKFRQIYGPAGR